MAKKMTGWIVNLWVICICAATLCMLPPQIFGIKPVIVRSGSMEPEIPVGSLAYINTRYPARKIAKDDVIVYKIAKTEVMHRVVEVDLHEKFWRTKGDANDCPDIGKILFNQYKGKQILALPYLGYILSFFFRGKGIIFTVLFTVILLATDFYIRVVSNNL